MRFSNEDDLASNFNERYQILIANNDALRNDAYRVRYQVFCKKLGYEMDNRDGLESDEFDRDSLHILLRERGSLNPVGCFRLVMPQRSGRIWLPFDIYGVPHVDRSLFNWNHVNHARSVEVSRLVINAPARRIGTQGDASSNSSFLVTTLFYAVSAMVIRLNVENVFMVIEPSLGRLTSRFGFKLDQISPPFEYYGQRATFTTTGLRAHAEALTLKTPWRHLLNVIEQQLFAEISAQRVA
ncbi:MAG TPA: PEP-CTERM/exosortase system-associated acyltransferase [Spongiibacteraceae bacterium]|jgi:N-acyl amino acid synthase of PEP-CTERM/exosortase system